MIINLFECNNNNNNNNNDDDDDDNDDGAAADDDSFVLFVVSVLKRRTPTQLTKCRQLISTILFNT